MKAYGLPRLHTFYQFCRCCTPAGVHALNGSTRDHFGNQAAKNSDGSFKSRYYGKQKTRQIQKGRARAIAKQAMHTELLDLHGE